MQKIKRSVTFILFILCVIDVSAQSYNAENSALANFLIRMYHNAPFEGVKVVSDYDNDYLLSVVHVKNSGSGSSMSRVAQVKSQRQVSQFLNGIVGISSETIIRTTEEKNSGRSIEEVTDIIREHSIGFTRAMQTLTVIDTPSGEKCYMFYRKIDELTD